MSDFSATAASLWKRLSTSAVRLFHEYANWLVGISWKRFFLLSLLLMIGAGVLSDVLPSWTVTELRDAPASPKAPAPPRPPHAPSITIDKGGTGSGHEDLTISIDKDGVRIGPRARAMPDAASAASSPASAASVASDAVEAVITRQGSVEIKLPPGATSDVVRQAVQEARTAIVDAIEESRQAAQDAADAAREAADAGRSGAGQIMRTRRVRIGESLPQLAFTFANGLAYVQGAIDAGLQIDAFAPRLSFFFACHNDLFEEVAKFRAARRMWARLMRDRFGASDASCKLRFHTQTGGVTLMAQQPLNNVVRVAVQTLAATLGGTQSLHTNGYDEALALPTAEAATLALRTQQIVAYESGITGTADPLAGSYFVEALTDEVERLALELLARVEQQGGSASAIEAGFFQDEIGRSAYEYQMAVERGSTVIVGVNKFADGELPPVIPSPDFSKLAREQVRRVAELKARRDANGVHGALAALSAAAPAIGTAGVELMPLIIDAVRARATVGEISDALEAAWGRYRPA